MPKLTKTFVDSIAPPSTGYALHLDTELKGFGVRVTATGVKSFYLEKRINGKPRRIKLGRYGDMTPELARKEAIKLAGRIASGDDPLAERARSKLESKKLADAFEDYISRRTLKSQTVFDIRRCMKEVYADWLNKPMLQLTGDMIVKRHQKYGAEHSEARANLAMRYLRAIYNFAAAEYEDANGQPIITVNPVKRLSATKGWYRVDRRQTLIKPHELAPWFSAVQGLPNADVRDYFITLVLSGLRREEALGLKWDTVDLAGKTLTVLDPKNHRDHTLPLTDYLFEILSQRKAAAISDYVFADSNGRRIPDPRHAQDAIEKVSGIKATPHDLRRTFATIAESLDIPAYALKRLLNHSDGADVTAGYIVANVERLRDPMQRITDYILRAAGVKETAEVVQLKQVNG